MGSAPASAARVALVTGAANGLGQEFSAALARHGHAVAGLDIADLEETARRAGPRFLGLNADVTDPASVGAAVERTVERLGGLHIVVNNAGVYPPMPFERTTLDDWRRIMRLNLEGPFIVTRAALPHLRAAGWGRIVKHRLRGRLPRPAGARRLHHLQGRAGRLHPAPQRAAATHHPSRSRCQSTRH